MRELNKWIDTEISCDGSSLVSIYSREELYFGIKDQQGKLVDFNQGSNKVLVKKFRGEKFVPEDKNQNRIVEVDLGDFYVTECYLPKGKVVLMNSCRDNADYEIREDDLNSVSVYVNENPFNFEKEKSVWKLIGDYFLSLL